MLWLAIETSGPQGSLALGQIQQHQCQLLSSISWEKTKSHSELITVVGQDLLQQHHLQLQDLQGIAVGIGPGSFTGLRVGINFARTLAYSLNLPLVAHNSLRILAEPALKNSSSVMSLTYGFRNLIYVAQYKKEKNDVLEILAPQALSFEDLIKNTPLLPLTIVGQAWDIFSGLWPQEWKEKVQLFSNPYPQSPDLLEILAQEKKSFLKNNWANVKPLYIRGAEAEEKLKTAPS